MVSDIQLPVVEGLRVVGILTEADFVHFFPLALQKPAPSQGETAS